ncbi:MAG: MFS transporter [Dehalococcoidia bacterium]|nr:MFS transporter [Dehalococcoidia bacterium]MSQ16479.1 MFS transporter [Dehalococcoidia bacterium]
MTSSTGGPRSSRIFYGWWVVASSSAMTFFASGLFFRGFTVFFRPVRDSLGLSDAQTALVFSLARAEGGLEGPAAGWAIDKFGNRALLVPCIILAAAGYFAFAWFVDDFWSFALVYLGMVSLGNSIAFQHAMFAGLNNWFRRRRSLAISVLAAISSLGGMVLVPVVSFIVLKRDWHWAAAASGVAYLVIVLPLTLWFRNRPEDMGLLPDGDAEPPTVAAPARGGHAARRLEIRDYTVREALRTRTYWFLLAGSGLRQLASLGIQVNIMPILVESKGVDEQLAATLVGLMFGITFASRLALGFFADRCPKAYLLGGAMALEGVGFLCLLLGDWNGSGIWLILAFIVLEGVTDGAGVIIWSALGGFYGRDRFASLRGIVTFSQSWAQVASPLFAGWVKDHYGNHQLAIMLAVVFALGASASCFLMRPPPQLTRERVQQPGQT